MSTLSRILVLIVVSVAFGIHIKAQTPAPISDEKRKLIADLMANMKIEEQTSKMSDEVLKMYEKAYPTMFANTIDQLSGFSSDEKSQMKAKMIEGYLELSAKFRKRLPEVINYAEFIQETFYPLYDKYYSEQELKDMIAFYKSSTGQKVVASTPLIASESTAASLKLLPKIMALMDELLKEQVNEKASPKAASSKN